ncbi:MAG: hypothetical protein JNL25_00745 [Rhodospirillaceae bacterium]|nr:hypothetical protein [Rhodospirillaceae bacterium]
MTPEIENCAQQDQNASSERLPMQVRLNTAAQLAVRARAFYEIWWTYEGADTRPLYLQSMNQYSEFFRFDSHATFVAMIVHTAMLYDKDDRTVGLRALLNEIGEHSDDATRIEDAKALLVPLVSVAKKVMHLRNNLFAHRNARFSYKEVFDQAAIAPDQVRDLIDAALQIANKLLVAIDSPEQFPNPYVSRHIQGLLESLNTSR